MRAPSDELTAQLVEALLHTEGVLENLTPGIYLPAEDEPGLGRLELGRKLLRRAAEARRKIMEARRRKELPRKPVAELVQEALEKGILTQEEAGFMRDVLEIQQDLIQVDSYEGGAYAARCGA